MAAPDISLHDSGGTEIASPITLPTATPGTPTAETVFSVRNNAAAGPAVDSLLDGRLTVLARLSGALTDPVGSGLAYIDDHAAQVRISAVSGGATAALTGWRPIGSGRSLSLGTIPDGAIVTCGVRTSASLAAALSAVEVFVAVEGVRSTALPDGSYELVGNFVYDGQPGGAADPDFTEVFSLTGSLDPGAADDTVAIWSEVRYTLAGVAYTTTPSPATQTFTNIDGDAAALLAGEAYYAAITLDGTDVPVITKGSKATAPLTDADKPTPPVGELLAGWVVVPFGLAIDTVEDLLKLGFFGLTVVSGLDVEIGFGRAAVGGRWVHSTSATSATLVNNQTSTVYVTPQGGLEIVEASVSPADGQSMPAWDIVTAAGAVTGSTDRRRIGWSDGLHPRLKRTTAATYIVTHGDHVVFANSDAAPVIVYLPAGVERRAVRVVNTGTSANTVSVTPDGAELLLGTASAFILNDGESLDIVYDPTDGWY